MSERRACTLIGADRSSVRYAARRPDDAALRARMREIAHDRRRFGYRRLHILLRREGWRINAKKTYRLYREEGLGVRVKRRQKRASQVRVVDTIPTFTPDGRYSDAIEIDGEETIVRESDGIHLNGTGSSIAAELVLDRIDEDFER